MFGCEKWRTVVRCASRDFLSAYFQRHSLLKNLQPEAMKRSALLAACQLESQAKFAEMESTLNDVYAFVKSPTSLERTLEDAAEREIDVSALAGLSNNYDRALYLYLHHGDLWEQAVSFLKIDALPKQVWCRCAELPRIEPRQGDADLKSLGAEISAYYRRKRLCGQFWDVDLRLRSETLYCYQVYFSDTPDFAEVWSERGERTEVLQTNVRNAVFYYDRLTGALDTFNWGGVAVARDLQQIFCRAILGYEFTDAQIMRCGFHLNHLKFRESAPVAVPEHGVTAVKVVSMTLGYAGTELNHRHKISRSDSAPAATFYDNLEAYFRAMSMPAEVFSVHKVELLLTVRIKGVSTKMRLVITRNSCTLRSYSDAVRLAGEHFLKANGIDRQMTLL